MTCRRRALVATIAAPLLLVASAATASADVLPSGGGRYVCKNEQGANWCSKLKAACGTLGGTYTPGSPGYGACQLPAGKRFGASAFKS
jgi:hypothetical protein